MAMVVAAAAQEPGQQQGIVAEGNQIPDLLSGDELAWDGYPSGQRDQGVYGHHQDSEHALAHQRGLEPPRRH